MRNWVEVDLKLPERWEGNIGVSDGSVAIETQVMGLKKDEQGRIKEAKLGFTCEVPPLGYKVYKVVPGKREIESKIKVAGEGVETPFFNLTVDKGNGIIEVYDKDGTLLVKGNEFFIDDEIGDLYHHRSRFADLIKSESGEGLEYGSFKPKSFKIEEGPLQTKIIFEDEYYCLTWPYRLKERFPPVLYKYKTLDIHKEVVVFRDLPRIEFVTRVKNEYPNIRLSVKFDVGFERKVYYRETQFGVTSEPTEYFFRTEGFKPSGIPNFLSWFDLSNGIRGITFMNKGLPANAIMGSSVFIRLFRSVYGLSADGTAGPLVPTPDALELRPYTFEYAIQLHDGDWRQAEMYKKAQDFPHAPLCIQSDSKGNLPVEYSFLKVSPDNIILSALKKAEDSEEVILRFFETKGETTMAELELFRPIKRAGVADLLEREMCELKADGNKLRLEVKPFEIVTLKLEL
jgi:Alpha-mannosidase